MSRLWARLRRRTQPIREKLAGEPIESAVPWTDTAATLGRLPADESAEWLRECVSSLCTRGYAVLRGVHSPALCDEVVEAYLELCRSDPSADKAIVRGRFHNRLVNFHLDPVGKPRSSVTQMALNPRVLTVLDFLFRGETVLYSTLAFELGSQQRLHRDCPHFYTNPRNMFFGVWHALEDVHPDAGPLQYFVGGHRVRDIAGSEISGRRGKSAEEFSPADYDAFLDEYDAQVSALCEGDHAPVEQALIRKGDVLIWHPLLPHGGAPANDPSRTRRSLVGHYVPAGVPVYNARAFFDPVSKLPARSMSYLEVAGRRVVASAPAYFQTTYLEPE